MTAESGTIVPIAVDTDQVIAGTINVLVAVRADLNAALPAAAASHFLRITAGTVVLSTQASDYGVPMMVFFASQQDRSDVVALAQRLWTDRVLRLLGTPRAAPVPALTAVLSEHVRARLQAHSLAQWAIDRLGAKRYNDLVLQWHSLKGRAFREMDVQHLMDAVRLSLGPNGVSPTPIALSDWTAPLTQIMDEAAAAAVADVGDLTRAVTDRWSATLRADEGAPAALGSAPAGPGM